MTTYDTCGECRIYSGISTRCAVTTDDERAVVMDKANGFVDDLYADLVRSGGCRVPRNAALVWPFNEAPAELRALSESGGDEDWLALWPLGSHGTVCKYAPRWHDALGAGDVNEYRLSCGALVVIGAHA